MKIYNSYTELAAANNDTTENATFSGELRDPNDSELAKRSKHKINDIEQQMIKETKQITLFEHEIKALTSERNRMEKEFIEEYPPRVNIIISEVDQLKAMGIQTRLALPLL